MASKATISEYYYLTKPGIVYGNLINALAGFLLACRWHINLNLLLATIFGIGLVIGSACVFNNYIDRDIDRKMLRTKKRALARGTISGSSALIYGLILGLTGFYLLSVATNLITVLLGLIGFADYVVIYTLSKRRFTQGTLLGSISGAIPPAAGYTAVTGHFNFEALLLFLILVLWQMPHFYCIAVYRYEDYKSAGIPVLPVSKSINLTRKRIMFYILAFTIAAMCLTFFGYTGYIYLVAVTFIGAFWLGLGFKSYKMDEKAWARRMFFISLVVICALSLMISIGNILR
jgi:protoheme IX farnesyltransferase